MWNSTFLFVAFSKQQNKKKLEEKKNKNNNNTECLHTIACLHVRSSTLAMCLLSHHGRTHYTKNERNGQRMIFRFFTIKQTEPSINYRKNEAYEKKNENKTNINVFDVLFLCVRSTHPDTRWCLASETTCLIHFCCVRIFLFVFQSFMAFARIVLFCFIGLERFHLFIFFALSAFIFCNSRLCWRSLCFF